MAKKKKKRPPAPLTPSAIKPENLQRCNSCGAFFGSEETLTYHARAHVTAPVNSSLVKKKRKARYAKSSPGIYGLRGPALQGGAPGLGKR